MERHARDKLLEELESRDEEVRRLAVERLTTLPVAEALPALVEQLADPSWRVRKAAIERLATSSEIGRAVPGLVEALADGDNPGRRNAALEALTRCGSAAVPGLLEASHDADVDVRKQVVDALAGIGDRAALPRLQILLSDDDPNVRGAAAEALGTLGDEEAVAPLLAAVRDEREPLVRISALRALDRLEQAVDPDQIGSALDDPLLAGAALTLLAHSDSPQAVDILLKALEGAGRSVRDAAAQSLIAQCARDESESGRNVQKVREAIPPDGPAFAHALDRVAQGPLPVRLALIQLLGMLGRAEAVPALLEAAGDEALSEVVQGALVAVGRDAVAPMREAWTGLSPASRRIACRVLAAFEDADAREVLTDALQSHDVEVRAEAARSLGACARGEAVPGLVELMARAYGREPEWSEDEEQDAALDALVALGRRDAEPVVNALCECLPRQGEGFKVAAARILHEVGRPEDAGPLELLTSDPSARVRRAAVEALAAISAETRLETLRMALADEDAGVRIGAAGALAACADASVLDDLVRLTDDPDERVHAAAVRALGHWCQDGLEADQERVLVQVSRALRQGGAVAMAGIEVLTELGGRSSVSLATSALGDQDPILVEAAVGCLGQHADVSTLTELFPLLAHDQWTVRARTVEVLSERRVETAVPAILRRLEAETDDFVRSEILRALDRLE